MLIQTDVISYPLFLPSIGPLEIAVIFIVVLILFGPGKLPDVFRALGEGVRQFKDASRSASIESESKKPSLPKDV